MTSLVILWMDVNSSTRDHQPFLDLNVRDERHSLCPGDSMAYIIGSIWRWSRWWALWNFGVSSSFRPGIRKPEILEKLQRIKATRSEKILLVQHSVKFMQTTASAVRSASCACPQLSALRSKVVARTYTWLNCCLHFQAICNRLHYTYVLAT